MNDVTKDLLEALLIVARMAEGLKKPCGMDPESPRAIRNAQYMNISYAARAAIARAEAALADAKNDSYRLDALEAVAKASGTGVSFDWCRHVEDGMVVEHGYRMMWKHTIGPREKSIRHAIDAAMGVFKP